MKLLNTIDYQLKYPFKTESGFVFPELNLNYKTWGKLNESRSNVTVICHALTGNADAEDWFSGLFHRDSFLNLEEDFVICINIPGSCYGSTGPQSINPTTGKPYKSSFPILTIRDIVYAQILLMDELKIQKIKCVIGGSMGGMQALEWALMDERVESAVVIAAPARHEAWAIGISEAQRAAIYADKNWNDGNYEKKNPPVLGLKAARMMAMVTYRTRNLYSSRFNGFNGNQYPADVSSYLNYQGEKLVSRFDALSYVRLTQCMDTHDISRDRKPINNVLAGCKTPILVIGISSDCLYPTVEQKFIANHLPNGFYKKIDSEYGHDGFLVEFEKLNHHLKQFNQDIFNQNC